MNVTTLLSRLRQSAFLAASSPDYPDSVLVGELNDHMTQLYTRAVVNARAGSWHMVEWYALAAGQRRIRMPPRAIMGAIERVQLSEVTDLEWFDIPEITEVDAVRYETTECEYPMRFVVRGDALHLLPPPTSSGSYVARIHYAIRPSRITTLAQTAGQVTAINTTARTLTVNSVPVSVDEAGSSTVISGSGIALDVVRPAGWYSVQWTGTASLSGTTFTLAPHASGLAEADDLSGIAVGDYVRAAGQTDWPAIPEDFHRSVADAAASKVLTMRGMVEDASALVSMHVTPDLQRFGDLLKPRVQSGAFAFVAPEYV